MDPNQFKVIQETLVNIERHLQALVNAQVASVMDGRKKAGAFDTEDEFNEEKVFDPDYQNQCQEMFVKEIYNNHK